MLSYNSYLKSNNQSPTGPSNHVALVFRSLMTSSTTWITPLVAMMSAWATRMSRSMMTSWLRLRRTVNLEPARVPTCCVSNQFARKMAALQISSTTEGSLWQLALIVKRSVWYRNCEELRRCRDTDRFIKAISNFYLHLLFSVISQISFNKGFY